jgi:hypothetical protein
LLKIVLAGEVPSGASVLSVCSCGTWSSPVR